MSGCLWRALLLPTRPPSRWNKKMKKAYIIKTGYSSGVHGCTDEHFCIIAGEHIGFMSSLYGGEHRIKELLVKMGFDVSIFSAVYGKVVGEDKKRSRPESAIIEEIQKFKFKTRRN